MNVRETIEKAEHILLADAYAFCRDRFSSVYLPSHDETHHLRVWHFAKTLMPAYHRAVHPLTPELIEGILLAAMLHDTGMAETFDETHGLASRRMAGKFFDKMATPPALAGDILRAIEKHDDKTYTSGPAPGTNEGIILSILSPADDMDAFGAIGVFRYYEIYLLRKVAVRRMAGKVLPNLDRRYEVIVQRLSPRAGDLTDIKTRYLTTRTFFLDLQAGKPEALSVIDLLEQSVRTPGLRPEEAIPGILKKHPDPYILDYFQKLREELAGHQALDT